MHRSVVHSSAMVTHGIGRVFWRTQNTSFVDRGMKAPLLTEKPYPMSEVVRRMVRVRCKYEDSTDFAERALLRGEYKYYTGKTCDLRHADTADLVACIECAAFFGFWDPVLLRLVEDRLSDRVLGLEPLALMLLFKSLSKIEMTASSLYLDVCTRLAGLADDGALTFDEVVDLIDHAVQLTPQSVLRCLVLQHAVPKLNAMVVTVHAVPILKGLALLEPASVSSDNGGLHTSTEDAPEVQDAAHFLHNRVMETADQLSPEHIASATHSFVMLQVIRLPTWASEQPSATVSQGQATVARLTKAFSAQLHEASPDALGKMVLSCSPFDRTFVVRARDRVEALLPQMLPAHQAAVLAAAMAALIVMSPAHKAAASLGAASTSSSTARFLRPSPEAAHVFHQALEAVRDMLQRGSQTTPRPVLVEVADVLGKLPAALRRSCTDYTSTVQALGAAVVAQSRSLDAEECVTLLQSAIGIGPVVGDAFQRVLLERVLQLGTQLPRPQVQALLREVRTLPPLPSAAARATIQHTVLPKLSDVVDGPAAGSSVGHGGGRARPRHGNATSMSAP